MIVRHRPAPRSFGSTIDPSFDRTFDQLTSSLLTPRRRSPDVAAEWDDDTLVLTVDLPGVPAESVSVEVAGRSLTLGAHTDRLEWSRSLQLGTSLDPGKVSAQHVDGRLTVRIGAVDAPETRTIPIDTSPADVAIADPAIAGSPADEAQSTESSSIG